MGGYEAQLVNSISRKPHDMTIMMLNRILNTGTKEINWKPILEILADIAENELLKESIRKDAKNYIEYQQKKVTSK